MALLKIANAAKAMPPSGRVSVTQLKAFLDRLLAIHGAGIPTLICMLAVAKRGKYPPIDRKVANGLLRLRYISERDAKSLVSTSTQRFADVYVSKVIPAWIGERKLRSAEEVDQSWGRAGDSAK